MTCGFIFVLAATFLASTLAFAQSSPLIMYHADNLDMSRKRGTLLLTGNVHFVHDSVAFRTQRASWNRNSETVECGGGFLFTHPSGFVRARNGSYQRKSEIAIASGEVSAGDSAGSYLMTGSTSSTTAKKTSFQFRCRRDFISTKNRKMVRLIP